MTRQRHLARDGALLCTGQRPRGLDTWVLSPAKATCTKCLNKEIELARATLATAEARQADLQTPRRRYRVCTYVTATTYCYVLARSADEAVACAFEACRVRPHTQSPTEFDIENGVWYTPKIDGIPVNDGSVEADLVAKEGAK